MIDLPLRIALMGYNQRRSRADVEALQERKLEALLSFASSHVPYYRKLGLSSLEEFPLLRKEAVRGNDELISDMHDKAGLRRTNTSGSSGMPLTTYLSVAEDRHRSALYCSRLLEAGLGPLDRMARIMLTERHYDVFRWVPGLFRSRYISLFQDSSRILQALCDIRPDSVISYPSVLILLAQGNLELEQPLSFRKVFSGAEYLSDRARSLIKRSFGCELRNVYGANETGPIAFECEEGSMHVHSDSVLIEVLDDGGEPSPIGKQGSVVVTPLWQRAMPLIRYDLGDRAALGPECSCGRGSHTIEKLEGRCDDYITLASGRPYHMPFDAILKSFSGILLFQVVQDEPGEVTVRIVPGRLPDPQKEAIISKLQAHIPEPTDIRIELVEDIPRTRRGKIRAVVSKVKHELYG